MITPTKPFLQKLTAARRASWQVFLIAMGIQLLTYCGYLAIDSGAFQSFIESGVYGHALTGQQFAIFIFVYTAALKLISSVILFVALFLTLWVRALRRAATLRSG